MTTIKHYLSLKQMECRSTYNSKKRVLEAFGLLFSDRHQLDPEQSSLIFDALLKREKIGSTALGNGIAIPHARINDLKTPKLAVITLQTAIDFDAPDQKLVDILISLLVPRKESNLHLSLLKQLATILQDKKLVIQLRESKNNKALYQILKHST